jgi:hypothetical protein
MSEENAIRFSAQVFKIQTLIDGGLRLTLDLCMPFEDKTIVALFDAKQPGVILECAAVAIKAESLTKLDKNENNKEKPKDGSPKLDRGRFVQRGD